MLGLVELVFAIGPALKRIILLCEYKCVHLVVCDNAGVSL